MVEKTKQRNHRASSGVSKRRRWGRLLEEGGEQEAAGGKAAEELVSQLRGKALQGPSLAAPGLHGGWAARRCVDTAVDQPHPAGVSGGDGSGGGCHGFEALSPRRSEPPL